jgi:hypothetical protein
MRRKRLARLLRKLRAMRKSLPKRDQLLMRVGAAKKEAGRAFGCVKIQLPKKDEEVTRATFTFHIDKVKLKSAEQRDGHYLLRSNLTGEGHLNMVVRRQVICAVSTVAHVGSDGLEPGVRAFDAVQDRRNDFRLRSVTVHLGGVENRIAACEEQP